MGVLSAINAVEHGLVPDRVSRAGIRRLLKERLRELQPNDCEVVSSRLTTFIEAMNAAPVAPLPEKANEQHYELPAEFFLRILGPHAKYSCCYWGEDVHNLVDAEEIALAVTSERARLVDGLKILELGCGWGSLTLYMAKRFPSAEITAVSNSSSQRQHILNRAHALGLSNLKVLTADMNDFAPTATYDRVVSLEMFEHMRNYRLLFARIGAWLVTGGLFFMHIFCHRNSPYEFVDRGPSDWMSRYFFSGGIMPSDELPLHFQQELRLLNRWRWNGRHYEKTLNAWLAQMDKHQSQLMPILQGTYGKQQAELWWTRWRLFFMACAELFGYNHGNEWWVSHYLFARPEV